MLSKKSEQENLPWDFHSDQPHVIKDQELKKAIRAAGFWGNLKTLLTLPLILLQAPKYWAQPRCAVSSTPTKIGLAVHVESVLAEKTSVDRDQLTVMLQELGVSHIMVRIPLADYDNLEYYIEYIAHFQDFDVTVNILQDSSHINDHKLLADRLRHIFSRLNSIVKVFQIGNAINRTKWAFASLDQYFAFYKVAQTVRDNYYPEATLLGSSVIDFEPTHYARTLFNRFAIKYDGVASLLYVDRRNAPENKQLGLDLLDKIRWLYAMLSSSAKTNDRLWITETNWPITGTEPYAPAVGKVMVSEQRQADYLTRYYLLVLASGKVERCYWHQLVAPGYGLIDNRGKEIRKRPAYYCFKTINELTTNSHAFSFKETQSSYELSFSNDKGNVTALWTNDIEAKVIAPKYKTLLDQAGAVIGDKQVVANGELAISGSVIYTLDYEL